MLETPFANVESAHRYVALLVEAVQEAREDIRNDIEAAASLEDARQLQALRLVNHQLTQLALHLRAVSRILNDLQMLRRVLLGESDD